MAWRAKLPKVPQEYSFFHSGNGRQSNAPSPRTFEKTFRPPHGQRSNIFSRSQSPPSYPYPTFSQASNHQGHDWSNLYNPSNRPTVQNPFNRNSTFYKSPPVNYFGQTNSARPGKNFFSSPALSSQKTSSLPGAQFGFGIQHSQTQSTQGVKSLDDVVLHRKRLSHLYDEDKLTSYTGERLAEWALKDDVTKQDHELGLQRLGMMNCLSSLAKTFYDKEKTDGSIMDTKIATKLTDWNFKQFNSIDVATIAEEISDYIVRQGRQSAAPGDIAKAIINYQDKPDLGIAHNGQSIKEWLSQYSQEEQFQKHYQMLMNQEWLQNCTSLADPHNSQYGVGNLISHADRLSCIATYMVDREHQQSLAHSVRSEVQESLHQDARWLPGQNGKTSHKSCFDTTQQKSAFGTSKCNTALKQHFYDWLLEPGTGISCHDASRIATSIADQVASGEALQTRDLVAGLVNALPVTHQMRNFVNVSDILSHKLDNLCHVFDGNTAYTGELINEWAARDTENVSKVNHRLNIYNKLTKEIQLQQTHGQIGRLTEAQQASICTWMIDQGARSEQSLEHAWEHAQQMLSQDNNWMPCDQKGSRARPLLNDEERRLLSQASQHLTEDSNLVR